MIRKRLKLILGCSLAALACSACAANPGQPSAPNEDPEMTLASVAFAPAPYTAEQLRAAHPVGTFTLYRLETLGQPSLMRRTTWTRSDAEGCHLEDESWPVDQPQTIQRSAGDNTWEELRQHAAHWPSSMTRIQRERASLSIGTEECLIYRVTEASADAGVATNTFWFPIDRPGSPARLEVQINGERQLLMELVETNRGG